MRIEERDARDMPRRRPSTSMEATVRIPKDIEIPVLVFALQAALLAGAALVFIVLSIR